MGKRGQASVEEIMWVVIEILITVALVSLMVTAAVHYGKKEPYEKEFFAKDIALILNSLQAIEGDFNLIYSLENLEKYNYKIKNGEITAAKGNFNDPTRQIYLFIQNKQTMKLDIELVKPAAITFVKRGNKISVLNGAIQPEKTQIICTETKNKDENWKQNKKILIDPLDSYALEISSRLKAKINPEAVFLIEGSDKIQTISFINPDIFLIIKSSDNNIPKITISQKNINENTIFQCLLKKQFYMEPVTEIDQLLNNLEKIIAVKIEINPEKYSSEETANIIYNAIADYYG